MQSKDSDPGKIYQVTRQSRWQLWQRFSWHPPAFILPQLPVWLAVGGGGSWSSGGWGIHSSLYTCFPALIAVLFVSNSKYTHIHTHARTQPPHLHPSPPPQRSYIGVYISVIRYASTVSPSAPTPLPLPDTKTMSFSFNWLFWFYWRFSPQKRLIKTQLAGFKTPGDWPNLILPSLENFYKRQQ